VGLTFLLRRADILKRTGARRDALEAGERAYAAAATIVGHGDLSAVGAAINAAIHAADLAMQEGDAPRGRALLAEARRLARSVRSANAELWILRNLFSLTLNDPTSVDWPSAVEYGLEAGRLLDAVAAGTVDTAGISAPEPALFVEPLRVLADHAYVDMEDYALSAALGDIWRKVAPGDVAATRHVALSRQRLTDLPAAEQLWRELLVATPDDVCVMVNLAGSLSGQGKIREAIIGMDRAIRIQPDDPMYRSFRVQLKRATGDIEGAIEDLDAVVRISEAQLTQDETPSLGPRTATQWQRNMPIRDRLDLALLERAVCHEKLGQRDRANADLDRVAREADAATAAHALRERSRLLSIEGRNDEALAALREAVQKQAPDDSKSSLALGVMLADRHEDTAAVHVLAGLVLDEKAAPGVVAALNPVIGRSPEDPQARLVRGFAAETARRPSIADEDFSVVLRHDPENAHMYYRRGRVRLMHGTAPEEAAWNGGLTTRVLDAARDLALGVSLDPKDDDARYSLGWLVDRICTTWRFIGAFLDMKDDPRGVFAVFPTLQKTLERFMTGMEASSNRDVERALSEWRAMQKELLELNMPVSACRIDTYLADALLRTFAVQEAVDHLDRAAQLLFLIGLPMSRELAAKTAETQRLTRQRTGQEAVVLEDEIRNVYGLLLEDMPKRVDILRIDALGRRFGRDARGVGTESRARKLSGRGALQRLCEHRRPPPRRRRDRTSSRVGQPARRASPVATSTPDASQPAWFDSSAPRAPAGSVRRFQGGAR
jgi:tetratricopeptide (TPR) repeat protein